MFTVRITVRGYETDTLGHRNGCSGVPMARSSRKYRALCGLLDLEQHKRPGREPAEVWREFATFPELLDLERQPLGVA